MDICICVEIEHRTGKRRPPRESGAPTLYIYPSNNAILKSQHAYIRYWTRYCMLSKSNRTEVIKELIKI